MIDLKSIGKTEKRSKVDLGDVVAKPGYAPKPWQSSAAQWTGNRSPIADSPDLRRILDLPRRERPTPDRSKALIAYLTDKLRRENTTCRCREIAPTRDACITEIRPTQAWALYEIGLRSGLVGPIGVGHGKTMLDILAPMVVRNCHLALLLVPPTLVDQLATEYQLLAQHFRVPSLVTHGKAYRFEQDAGPVLHVFPYSRLSRPEATVFLEQLKPDTIIADECHKLRHADTARTARVLRYFKKHPSTRFMGWSGSITDSSIGDYSHLAALALREHSPLPINPETVSEWSKAIDPSDSPAPPGMLLKFCDPGEHVHSGFHRRLVETQGVVTTTTSAIDADLEIFQRSAPPIPANLAEALDGVRETWMRPDGEELVDALQVSRCLRELACGFFYRWIFPRGEAPKVIERWLEVRKAWRRELRVKLQNREEHLDSPRLCALAAMRAWGEVEGDPNLPHWKAKLWPEWRRVKDTVQPETQAVRVSDYLARDAAAWGSDNSGIIWYEHSAFGEWIAEISGLPLHGGGANAGIRIGKEKGDRSIIASLKSHGTGRDGLQRLFRTQLVANPPSSATTWEQMLGRLHRIGQKADSVNAEFYRHTPELRDHVDQALRRALYVQGTLGAAQKLKTGWRIKE